MSLETSLDNIVRVVTSGVQGTFAFYDLPPGTYNVAAKGARWLQQVIPNVTTEGGNNVLNLRIFLRGGDADDNNVVDVDDLSLFIRSFDADPTSDNWNDGQADFNCDHLVDVNDLDILIRHRRRSIALHAESEPESVSRHPSATWRRARPPARPGTPGTAPPCP